MPSCWKAFFPWPWASCRQLQEEVRGSLEMVQTPLRELSLEGEAYLLLGLGCRDG